MSPHFQILQKRKLQFICRNTIKYKIPLEQEYDTLLINTQDAYGRELYGQIPVSITLKYWYGPKYYPTYRFGYSLIYKNNVVVGWALKRIPIGNIRPNVLVPWEYKYNVNIKNPIIASKTVGNWSVSN